MESLGSDRRVVESLRVSGARENGIPADGVVRAAAPPMFRTARPSQAASRVVQNASDGKRGSVVGRGSDQEGPKRRRLV